MANNVETKNEQKGGNTKNPFAYIKHLVKDPINTIEEADARKKEIMPWFYGFLGLMVVSMVLQVALELEFMATVSFIGLVGVAFFGFLLAVIRDAKQRFMAMTCDKCNTLAVIKTPEDYAKYISFTIEKDQANFKGYVGNKEPTNGVFSLVKYVGTSTAIASVQLICPHCGEVKQLKYSAEPFKCHAEATKVGALQFPAVSASLENAVRSAVNDYNDPSRKELIPYTLHSSKNPNFEARTTFKGANAPGAHPEYMGVKIDYRKDVDEMIEHYFLINELNGKLYDPSKKDKSLVTKILGLIKK